MHFVKQIEMNYCDNVNILEVSEELGTDNSTSNDLPSKRCSRNIQENCIRAQFIGVVFKFGSTYF